MTSIGVLITCHNRKEKTLKCLEYLLLQNKFQVDVFLVDDGSIDGTSDAVRRQFPPVHIIKGNGNLFWNRGMILAWKEAAIINHDFYLWLNDDTFLFENSLEILIATSLANENQAIIVGTTISEISKLITYGGRDKNGSLIEPKNHLQACHHFNGNVVLIPNNVFERIGFLDSVFHHAMGDFDYGMRAKEKGVQVFIASEIIGYCET